MRDLHITVNNKVATYHTRDGNIVCGNSDYQIVFTFDAEWDNHTDKVARFIWNNKYVDVVFTGNTVTVPILARTNSLKVGVYAGELCTTTPAQIPCVWSVLCESGAEGDGEPLNPVIIDLSGYVTEEELNKAIANAITTTLNTEV